MKKLLAAAGVVVLVAALVFVWPTDQRPKAVLNGVPADSAGTSSVSPSSEAPHTASADSSMPPDASSSSQVRAPTLNQIVESSASFTEAIAKARTAFGDTDPRVFELLSMADAVCSQPPDPTDATNPKHPDPMRSWAVARLLNLCEGYKPESTKIQSGDEPPSLAQIYAKQGKDAAVSEANRVLRTANDYDSLYSAGQILLETGAMPLDQILPGHKTRYGPADLIPAWAVASQLAGCSGGSACGPDSLPTAMYCAHAGCVQGVTYEQALTQGLPPAQLRAVMAFRQWILAQRQDQP